MRARSPASMPWVDAIGTGAQDTNPTGRTDVEAGERSGEGSAATSNGCRVMRSTGQVGM